MDFTQLENDARIWLQSICSDSSSDNIDKTSLKKAIENLDTSGGVKITGIDKADFTALKSSLGKKFKKNKHISSSEVIHFLRNQVTKKYNGKKNQEYDLMFFSKVKHEPSFDQ